MNITKILDKAMFDENLSSTDFRIFRFILRGIDYNNGSVEKTNAYIAEKLHVSIATVKRATKNLTELGYLEKATKGSQYNRRGNIYTHSSRLKNEPFNRLKNEPQHVTHESYNTCIIKKKENITSNNISSNIKKKEIKTHGHGVLLSYDFNGVDNKFKEYLEVIASNEYNIRVCNPIMRSHYQSVINKTLDLCIGLLQCGVITQEEYNQYLDYFYV